MPKSATDFAETFGQPKMRRLERELANEKAKLEHAVRKAAPVHLIKSKANSVRFGVFGDTQIGSVEFYAAGVKAFYHRLVEEGIDLALHTGDVLDGNRMYRGQEFELRDVGFDAQKKRFIDEMPQTKVTTKFITGNHDASFKAQIGVNVGNELSMARPDWIYLGEDQATVRFGMPDGAIDVMLLHPAGGTAYALSYRPQRIVEQMEGGTKPNLLCIGHFHKAEFIPSYRNIAVLQSGCMCWQTPFMMRKGLAAHVGGWIVEAVAGESWNMVKVEFIAFYR